MRQIAFLLCAAALGRAEVLTLVDAEARALRDNPALRAARANARVAAAQPAQVRARAGFLLDGTVTGSIAEHGTRMGVGGINAPDLFSRIGLGIGISQLITDFGRTSLQARGSEALAQSAEDGAQGLRAVIRLRTRSAYYRALAAEAGRGVARETVTARETILRQAQAYAESNLRSILDVGFAEVRLAEGRLLVTRADNAVRSALIDLAEIMGANAPGDWQLQDPAETYPDMALESLVAEALAARPEIRALQSRAAAAKLQLDSDKRLNLPTVTASGVAGIIPVGDQRLRPRYLGVGVNINVPILNGGAFSARQEASAAELGAVEAELRENELRVRGGVQRALLELETARQNAVTLEQMETQAARVLRLGEERYRAGLGSIVEYNQAQIDWVTARLAAAVARYEVRAREAAVTFETGRLAR